MCCPDYGISNGNVSGEMKKPENHKNAVLQSRWDWPRLHQHYKRLPLPLTDSFSPWQPIRKKNS
jgi:hypothetical protein